MEEKLNKLKNELTTDAKMIKVLSWIGIIPNILLFFILLIVNKYFPYSATSELIQLQQGRPVILMILSSSLYILYILLSKRIQNLNDIRMKRYLWIIAISQFLLFPLIINNFSLGFIPSITNLLLTIITIIALVKVTEIYRIENFKSSLIKVKYTWWKLPLLLLTPLFLSLLFGI